MAPQGAVQTLHICQLLKVNYFNFILAYRALHPLILSYSVTFDDYAPPHPHHPTQLVKNIDIFKVPLLYQCSIIIVY